MRKKLSLLQIHIWRTNFIHIQLYRRNQTYHSKNVIYMIHCNHCSKQYIGETKRRLKDRFNEHRRLIDIVCETLRKEGHASRNIGNKKNLFPYVKSALLLLFNISSYSWLDPLFGSGPTFFVSWSLLPKLKKGAHFGRSLAVQAIKREYPLGWYFVL